MTPVPAAALFAFLKKVVHKNVNLNIGDIFMTDKISFIRLEKTYVIKLDA